MKAVWFARCSLSQGVGLMVLICVVLGSRVYAQDIALDTLDANLTLVDVLQVSPVPYLQEYVDEGMISEGDAELIGKIRPTVADHREQSMQLCDEFAKDTSLPYMVRRWVNLVGIFYAKDGEDFLRRGEKWLDQSSNDYRLELKLRTCLATRIVSSSMMNGAEQLTTVERLMRPLVDDEQYRRIDTVYAILNYVELRHKCTVKTDIDWSTTDEYKAMEDEDRVLAALKREEQARECEVQLLETANRTLETHETNPEQTPGFAYLTSVSQTSVISSAKREVAAALAKRAVNRLQEYYNEQVERAVTDILP